MSFASFLQEKKREREGSALVMKFISNLSIWQGYGGGAPEKVNILLRGNAYA